MHTTITFHLTSGAEIVKTIAGLVSDAQIDQILAQPTFRHDNGDGTYEIVRTAAVTHVTVGERAPFEGTPVYVMQ